MKIFFLNIIYLPLIFLLFISFENSSMWRFLSSHNKGGRVFTKVLQVNSTLFLVEQNIYKLTKKLKF